MADEPSIDEILASLDKLLREGEGRNDEPEQAHAPSAGDTPVESSHDAPTPHFFEVLDDEAADEAPDRAGADDAGEEAWSTPPAAESPEPASDSGLFVLTEDMRIDDQPSLPLGVEDAGEEGADEPASAIDAMRQELELPETDVPVPAESEAPEPPTSGPLPEFAWAPEPEPGFQAELEPEPEPGFQAEPEPEPEPEPGFQAEPEPGMDMQPPMTSPAAWHDQPEQAAADAPAVAWDETEIQALVDQVTDDVCSAVAEQLPEMIRMALAQRLAAFIAARTNPQDTGTEE